MRGKEAQKVKKVLEKGITPARAGKSTPVRWQQRSNWDHPRACGEKFDELTHFSRKQGSPPRVRGKGFPCSCRLLQEGITPARAGKSCTPSAVLVSGRDHPRACGEKSFSHSARRVGSGSPPRVRGKASERLTTANYDRITPARAGKRYSLRPLNSACWDHPRACGEKHCRKLV